MKKKLSIPLYQKHLKKLIITQKLFNYLYFFKSVFLLSENIPKTLALILVKKSLLPYYFKI